MDISADKHFDSLLYGIIFLGLGFLIGWCNTSPDAPRSVALPAVRSGSVTSVRSKPDSASQLLEVHLQEVNIRARANRHAVIHPTLPDQNGDTTLRVYCIDTVVRSGDSASVGDTLEVCHTLPIDSFAISVRFAPRDTVTKVFYTVHDSLIRENDTITLGSSTLEKPKDWYEEPLKIFGALVAGFLLGELKK